MEARFEHEEDPTLFMFPGANLTSSVPIQGRDVAINDQPRTTCRCCLSEHCYFLQGDRNDPQRMISQHSILGDLREAQRENHPLDKYHEKYQHHEKYQTHEKYMHHHEKTTPPLTANPSFQAQTTSSGSGLDAHDVMFHKIAPLPRDGPREDSIIKEVPITHASVAAAKLDTPPVERAKWSRFREKKFVCDDCDRSFTLKQNVAQHYFVYHNPRASLRKPIKPQPKRYQCTKCDKIFRCIEKAKRHEQRVHSEKPAAPAAYVCHECSKVYSTPNQLKEHDDVVHKHLRPHKCPECKLTFGRLGGLRRHIQMVHVNVRHFCPYPDCNHPGYKCTKALAAHIRAVHTHDRPFKCLFCEKAFVRKNDLKVHEITHTVASGLHCEKCGTSFKRDIYLQKHRRRCGREDEQDDSYMPQIDSVNDVGIAMDSEEDEKKVVVVDGDDNAVDRDQKAVDAGSEGEGTNSSADEKRRKKRRYNTRTPRKQKEQRQSAATPKKQRKRTTSGPPLMIKLRSKKSLNDVKKIIDYNEEVIDKKKNGIKSEVDEDVDVVGLDDSKELPRTSETTRQKEPERTPTVVVVKEEEVLTATVKIEAGDPADLEISRPTVKEVSQNETREKMSTLVTKTDC